MKKIILLIIGLMFLSFVILKSQPACEPCSSQTTWANAPVSVLHVVISGSGCEFDVEYQTIFCLTDGTCNFRILKLYNILEACDGYGPLELLEQAALQIIKNDGMFKQCWPSGSGDCVEQTREWSAACWKWKGNVGPGPGTTATLKPCETESCCESYYMICNEGGAIIVYKTYTEATHPCVNPGPECFIRCDSGEK